MNNRITANMVKERFAENGIAYCTLPLGGDWFLLLSDYGGRILGPFCGEEGESLFWACAEFADREAFAALVKSRTWNIGGDRYWLNPELSYFIRDRRDFFGSYIVQDALDPGHYQITEEVGTVTLCQSVTLAAFDGKNTKKTATMRRTIRPIQNPFAASAPVGVSCFAFLESVGLSDTGEDAVHYLEPWILTQLNPRGYLLVPHTGKELHILNYYEDIPASLVTEKGRLTQIEITGDLRYKIGLRATELTGRSGFLGHLTTGESYLLVKNHLNDPTNLYTGVPNKDDRQTGCSMFVYNDPGSQGGFGEYETAGRTVSGDTGRKTAEEEISYSFFVGREEELLALAEEIL